MAVPVSARAANDFRCIMGRLTIENHAPAAVDLSVAVPDPACTATGPKAGQYYVPGENP